MTEVGDEIALLLPPSENAGRGYRCSQWEPSSRPKAVSLLSLLEVSWK